MKKMIYATIYTMDRDHPTAEAMGIEEDHIFFTGTREEARAIEVDESLAYPDQVILPGFIDTHVHVIPSGLFMTGADLSQAEDLAESQHRPDQRYSLSIHRFHQCRRRPARGRSPAARVPRS